MKIRYLDGYRFFNAFIAGGQALIKNRNYLNKINVFPVADADTGTNLATTIRSILEDAQISRSLKQTLSSVAESALTGARGNSGIIFAQYLVGISNELEAISESVEISVENFARTAHQAVKHVYDSLLNPVEGTMLTVIREWSESLEKHSKNYSDFCLLLQASFEDAQRSLRKTPQQLKILAESGVVDAGAKGFVDFLGGVIDFIQSGSLRKKQFETFQILDNEIKNEHNLHDSQFRYCTEAIISNVKISLADFKENFKHFGDSFIVAGIPKKIHLHIHTNEPARFFQKAKKVGTISSIKVDDMQMQYQISHKRKYPIGIITDSACDLPAELIEHYQIQQVSFGINYGENIFLDKKTINARQFYKMLKTEKAHPVSSQPSPKRMENVLDFMSEQYEKVYAVHISKHLSGIFQTAQKITENFNNVKTVNSRHLSVSEGLIVMRLAEAIAMGFSPKKIEENLPKWIQKTRILTDINTLKYLVRGGRISALKGILASILNLKPIISVDQSGKGIAYGKSLSRSRNMKKIVNEIVSSAKEQEIWNYAIVHADAIERAEKYADILTEKLGKEPAYIMPLSPVVGVHNGIGAVGIGIMQK